MLSRRSLRYSSRLWCFDSKAAAVQTQKRDASDNASTALLEYEETTCGSADRSNEATGIIVHGLLGSGRNWRSFSRALAQDLAQATSRPWRFWLVDQRCHGNSLWLEGLQPPSTVAASAADLGRLLDANFEGGLEAIIGHSLGGKVVMELLRQREGSPYSPQVWVLDSVVGAARPADGEPSDVKRVLDEVAKIKMPIPSRDWLYRHLESRGFSSSFRLWMGSNLQVKDGKYWWTFDVGCAQQLYDSYQTSEFWDLVRSPPPSATLNLVRAAKSDRWSEKQWERLKAAEAASGGRLRLHILPKAGHWLHADNPEGLRQLLASNISAKNPS